MCEEKTDQQTNEPTNGQGVGWLWSPSNPNQEERGSGCESEGTRKGVGREEPWRRMPSSLSRESSPSFSPSSHSVPTSDAATDRHLIPNCVWVNEWANVMLRNDMCETTRTKKIWSNEEPNGDDDPPLNLDQGKEWKRVKRRNEGEGIKM